MPIAPVSSLILSIILAEGAPPERVIASSIAMPMVLIAPGEFTMGWDGGSDRERPAHNVRIEKPIFMAVTEVTQAQWEAIMHTNPSPKHRGPNVPVSGVSYFACREFCRRVSLVERAAGLLPDGVGYRLPTEAEWEYACRAGATTQYCFGDDQSELGGYGWYKGNSNQEPHEVGKKKPNAWGLYDMHGNVGEWCASLWREYGTGPRPAAPRPLRHVYRVLRGGSYDDDAATCRSSDRCFFPSSRGHYALGFRIVRTVP